MTTTIGGEYPADVDAHITLDAERRIHFRGLRTGEETPIRALDKRLSVRTRHQRFLSPMRSVPDALVRQLASVDYQRSLAIVAENETSADEVIGLASYSAVDDETAEVALVVEDGWQGRGVGTALVEALLGAAERRGFSRFAASMTSDNVAMRRILNRVGHVVSRTTRSGVSELVFVRRNRFSATSREPGPTSIRNARLNAASDS